MNVLRFIINSNTLLAEPVNKPEETIVDKPDIITEYENKIAELEKALEEQQKIINELKNLIYNQTKSVN